MLLAVSAAVAGCGGGDDGAPDGDRAPVQQQAPAPDAADPQVAPQLGFPMFATSNTTRVGGAAPIADAAAGVAVVAASAAGHGR